MVETFTRREVQISGQEPGYLNVNYSPDSFGASVGRALMGAADTFAQLADAQDKLDQKRKANDAHKQVQMASDAARPWFFDPKDGIFAKQGGNAIGTGGQASAVLTDIKKKYIDSIEDPQTREAAERMWFAKEESYKDSTARHELGQLGEYSKETTKGVLLGSMQDAYNLYNDQKGIDTAIGAAMAAIDDNQLGQPPEAIANAKREAKSQIHLAVVSRWASENPHKALEYLEAHKGDLWGKDHVTAAALVDAAKADRQADEWISRVTSVSPTGEALFNAVEFAESGGARGAVSSAGALGVMQLMPGTARDELVKLGMTKYAELGDKELKELLLTDPSLNRMVGRSHLTRLIKAYNNDVEAALVAYNAGPEWANEWLAENAGRPAGSRSYDVTKNKKLKSETEPYVQKVLGRLRGTPGSGSDTPPGLRMTRATWDLKNFKPSDLMAPTEGGQWVDARAARGLDNLADRMAARFPGLKVKINEEHTFDPSKGTAGKRRGTSDPKDNPHVDKSYHLRGSAFDIQVQGWSDEQKAAFIAEARALGFRGFGFYGPNGHLHIDMGNERTWGRVPAWAKEPLRTPLGQPPEGSIDIPDQGGWPQTNLPAGGGDSAFGPAINQFLSSDGGAKNLWMSQIEEIEDPRVRERARAKLGAYVALQEYNLAQEQAQLKSTAWQTVINGGTKDLTADLLARLEPSFVNSLYSYEENRASGKMPMDWEAWSRIPTAPEELAALDPYTEYRNRLDDDHFDRLLTMHREAQATLRGDAASSKLLANQRTTQQILEGASIEMGFDKDSAEFVKLSRAVDRRIRDEQTILGKELDSVQIQDIVDKLLIEDAFGDWNPLNSTGYQGRAMDVTRPEEFIAADSWDSVARDDQQTLIRNYEMLWNEPPDQDKAVDLYNRAMVVWLGGRPSGPEEETQLLRSALEKQFNRRVTDLQFENYYAKYLLSFLGYKPASRP